MHARTLFPTLLISMAVATQAHAHASFVAGIPVEGKSYVATLNIGHGCEDPTTADTTKVEVSIPANVTTIRPMDSVMGTATIEKDGNDKITKLVWTKPGAGLDADTHFYQVTFKLTVPAGTAMTALAFDTTQTCVGGGTISWAGASAPTLKVVPARTVGWNKYTAQSELSAATIAAFFPDAQIVWYNDTAYSANAVTTSAIKTPLTTIPAGGEFWVKF